MSGEDLDAYNRTMAALMPKAGDNEPKAAPSDTKKSDGVEAAAPAPKAASKKRGANTTIAVTLWSRSCGPHGCVVGCHHITCVFYMRKNNTWTRLELS